VALVQLHEAFPGEAAQPGVKGQRPLPEVLRQHLFGIHTQMRPIWLLLNWAYGSGANMKMQELLHNRQAFPAEELARYAGMHVAWSPDGTRIIAADQDLLRLDAKIKEAGHNPAEILVSSVPTDEVILGGGGTIG
jgi:hypothetical protein